MADQDRGTGNHSFSEKYKATLADRAEQQKPQQEQAYDELKKELADLRAEFKAFMENGTLFKCSNGLQITGNAKTGFSGKIQTNKCSG